MEIKTIGTGSTGNCYILQSNNEHNVILDCGLPFEEITSHPLFPKFRNIDFVFCGHEHKDHSKSLKDFKRSGCDIVSYETLKKEVQQQVIGNFTVTTFPVVHNVDNWGIVICDNTTHEKLCYVTDFNAMPKVESIDYWLYEINYVEKGIEAQIDKGRDFKHTNWRFHNSEEKAVEYFSSLKTRPKNIIICHLSNNNGDYKHILTTMSQFADNVVIAKDGGIYEC